MNASGKLICFFVALVLIISGCSTPNATSSKTEDKQDKETQVSESDSKTLKIMVRPHATDVDQQHWDKVVEAFETKHEGVTVEVQSGDVAVESGKLPTMLNSGITPPDAILINAGPARVSVLSNAGLIDTLNTWYENNNWKEKMNPMAFEMASIYGDIYEMPHFLDYTAIGYNSDILEKENIEVPTTPEALYSSMDRLKELGYTPFALGARAGFGYAQLFGQMLEGVAGTEAVEELFFGEGKWTDPPILKTAQLLKEWVDKGYIAKEAVSLTYADQVSLFTRKEAAFFPDSAYNISDYIAADVEDTVGTMTFPAFTEGVQPKPTGGIGYTWVVPSGAENKDLAEQWLNFMMEDYTEIAFSDPNTYFVPATKQAFELTPAGSMLAEMIDKIEGGQGHHPTINMGNEAKEAFIQNIPGIIGGLVTPEEAMANIEVGKQKDIEKGFSLKKE